MLTAVSVSVFFLREGEKSSIRPDLMRDRKRKTAFFDLDFSIRKKKLSYTFFYDRKSIALYFHKIGPYLKKIYIPFSDKKIQIEKRRFSFSISHKIGPNTQQ